MPVIQRSAAVALCATLLLGCASTPGRYPIKDTQQTSWTVQPRSLGKVPEDGILYAIKKDNGRWVPATKRDEKAEKLVLTTAGDIYLYTKGRAAEDFYCGFSLIKSPSPGCESRFVGKAKASEHFGDLLVLPIGLFYLTYPSFAKIQTDKLADAVHQSGILGTASVALQRHAQSLAKSRRLDRENQASQQRAMAELQAMERALNAQETLKQGIGGQVCQDYTDSFGKPMQRIAFVERIANDRIQIRTNGVRFVEQSWVTIDQGQRLIWDAAGNWRPCR